MPPPLAAFGERHGVAWPSAESARFFVKGSLEDEAQLLQVDRMIFFWAGGFDLGGETLRAILVRLGARAAVGEGNCHLAIRNDDPDGRVEALAEFLREEDLDDQFTVSDAVASLADAYSSITVIGPRHRKRIVFDDSGVHDWAFTAQLSDEDPALL